MNLLLTHRQRRCQVLMGLLFILHCDNSLVLRQIDLQRLNDDTLSCNLIPFSLQNLESVSLTSSFKYER